MKRSVSSLVGVSVIALSVALGVSAFAAETIPGKGFVVTPISKGSTTASGQPLVYPAGKAEATAAIVTIEPGGDTGKHQHPIPQYAYILEGTVIVQADGGKERIYKAGDGFLEDVNLTHQGWNRGETPAKMLIVYMGVQGKAGVVEAK
jgi:quercetin dioxygenase-like cupin family protein